MGEGAGPGSLPPGVSHANGRVSYVCAPVAGSCKGEDADFKSGCFSS